MLITVLQLSQKREKKLPRTRNCIPPCHVGGKQVLLKQTNNWLYSQGRHWGGEGALEKPRDADEEKSLAQKVTWVSTLVSLPQFCIQELAVFSQGSSISFNY